MPSSESCLKEGEREREREREKQVGKIWLGHSSKNIIFTSQIVYTQFFLSMQYYGEKEIYILLLFLILYTKKNVGLIFFVNNKFSI